MAARTLGLPSTPEIRKSDAPIRPRADDGRQASSAGEGDLGPVSRNLGSTRRTAATLILLLFACNVLRVIAYGSMGLFRGPILEMSLLALPFFAVALVVGHRIHHLISEKVYRYSVYTLLFAAAVSLTLKGLLA